MHLDKKWVIQIERLALIGPFLIMLSLLLGIKQPFQPLWLFSICYVVSYVITFLLGWKGALYSCVISAALLFPALRNANLWHLAEFGAAFMALFIMGLCKEELHKNLFQYYRDRQSLVTIKEQLELDREVDRNHYKEALREHKNTLEEHQKEIEELKNQKSNLENIIRANEQNVHRALSERKAIEEQLFIERRERHRTHGIIEQLRAQLHHFDEYSKKESEEARLLEQINHLRVEKFELSVLESSHLNEKLRMEQQLKELKEHYDELLQELDHLQKLNAFTPPEIPTDEVAIAYTQLKKQFDEKRSQLHESRKEYFVLEGQSDAFQKLKELEVWNKEAELFSIISLQNELVMEIEEKEKEIESLEDLLTAGLQGKKDRPRLPPMKKLQTRSKRKKA